MNRKITCVAVGAVMAFTSVGATTVSAAKAKAPGRAIIVRIISTKQTRSLSKVTITVELPPANGSPIIETVVSGNGRKCVIKKNARSCTVYRVESNVGFPWTAQSRNKIGKGPVSGRVDFMVRNGRWLRSGYTPKGLKYPARIVNTTSSRILQQGSGVQKWSKFQAIKQSGITAASVRIASLPQTNPPTITFRTSGVIGLALPTSNSTGSGLLAVNRDGTVIDAVQSGTASIRDFYSAPNNKFYVVFSIARPLYTGGPNCVLAEVDSDSGNPVCVDSQISSVTTLFGMNGFYGMSGGNSPIQFDNAGNIYYVGFVTPTGNSQPPIGGMVTLRKNVNGTVSNLISDNVTIRDFVVLGDGTVILSGTTTSTQTSWVRKITPSGSLSNLSATSPSTFIKKFADGNVYLGFNGSSSVGVRRYLTSTGALDSKWWISGFDFINSHFQTASVCNGSSGYQKYPGYCGTQGSFLSTSFNIGNSSTVVVAGLRGQNGTTLMQYYPTVEPLSTSIKNVTLAQMVGNKLILAGSTDDSVNSLVVFDLATYQETILVDASNEVEVYNMSYIAGTNKIMFNGLRFSDNTFVVGEVDMP
jgi:hypothetical protein